MIRYYGKMQHEWHEIKTPEQRAAVAGLFDGIDISLVNTFVQGYGERGWCDRSDDPSVAVFECQGLLFYGGNPLVSQAERFAAFLPTTNDEWHVFCNDDGWLPLIEDAHPNRTQRYIRYGMNRDLKAFNRELLLRATRNIPPEYETVRIGKGHYELAVSEDWSRDFCSFFKDLDDFLKNGIGFCAIREDQMVSGASSFTIFDGGIEVQVETHQEYRRHGLATACSAALILACIEENRLPCWDAFCEHSRDLALKLGYTIEKEYTALLVNRHEN